MSFLSPKKEKPVAPPKAPEIDEAQRLRSAQDQARIRRRGFASTVLTSEGGLPDLGTSVSPTAKAG